MKSFRSVLYTRIAVVTSVAIGLLVAGNLAFLFSVVDKVIGQSNQWLSATQEAMLVEQIKLARTKVYDYFEQPSEHLALVARGAQAMVARAQPSDANPPDATPAEASPADQSDPARGLLDRFRYHADGNWVQTDPGGPDVITIWGNLLNPDHSIPPGVIGHLVKYAPVMPLVQSLMHIGQEKQWAYMLGPAGRSYLRLAPYSDIGAKFDTLYPGHNEAEVWQFFFPGATEAWQARPADFNVLDAGYAGPTFTLPYEDAAGGGIILSVFQPLYTPDNQFDGVVAVDLKLENVIDFLASLKVGQRGFALLARDNGDLLSLDPDVAARLGLRDGGIKQVADENKLRVLETNLSDSTRFDFNPLLAAAAPDNHFQRLACADDCDTPMRVLASTLPAIWEYDGQSVQRSSYRLLFFVPDDEFAAFASGVRAAFDTKVTQLVAFQIVFALLFLAVLILALLLTLRYLISALTDIQRASTRIIAKADDIELRLPPYREFADVTQAFNAMAAHVKNQTEVLEQEIRKRTQALEQETRRATQASQAKSDFLANMSHEIRTPMNAVLGLAYLLTRQDLPKEAHALARKIQTSGQSLLGIINDILDVSKIEAGKIELESTPFRLSEVLDNLATIMAGNAQDKAIELIMVPPLCSAWTLRGDPLRLGQILINLTNNAIKFTDQGSVTVKITVLDATTTRVRLRFAVQDTGIGIDAATQARLFQPFVQADTSTQRRFGGSGLGLVIARRLVELMGGEMRLDSTLGEGSTFWFELPFAVEKLVEHSPLTMRVLVVAAEQPDSLLATVVALGWTAQQFTSCDQALARLREERALQGADTAVLLALDAASALDSAKAIRAALPEARRPLILMLSSHRTDEYQAAETLDGVLTKPLTPSHLYDAVLLARRRRLGEPIAPPPTARHAQRLTGLHLLVVDDNEVNREVARGIFTDEGARVTLACDGQQALDWLIAQPHSADLVLMDVQMPVLDGLAATRAIRQHPDLGQLPVIALTAGAMPEQQSAARDAGVDGFLSKPFDVDDAVALIASLLGAPLLASGEGSAAQQAAAGSADQDDADLAYPGLNLIAARTIWKDMERYRQYLAKFASEQTDTARRIAVSEPGQAQRLAHAIKGAAGNLGLLDVAARASDIEQGCIQHIATERLADATEALQAALEIALASIARFTARNQDQQEPSPAGSANQPDPAQIAPLLGAAHSAFADFEPLLAEAPLRELARLLTDRQLTPLRQALENLDASAGKAAAQALANALGIRLESD